ncbi:hypothetical protein DXX93_00460 [Thalassotalea euphylliae]|uniref:DUF4340 domain-containing protein n=1 Tax=Thalassotalea euphylliae TaxID=1655234 RepID=A0A3E0TL59_9GAMM|nr:hypothetical protein [Thalassotalea euphylliae]REL25173.1 hypothetical protein DXX93_00460 [Thalassotalea euphylliae]
MRLSRAAWNNVIIFSVMGFILLINFTQLNKDESAESMTAEHYVIGENKVILTMNIDQQVTIERAGQAWRLLPEQRISAQLTEQMMRTWQQAQGKVIDVAIDRAQQSGLFISMVLADKPNIQLFSLYLLSEQVIVHNHQTDIYVALPAPMFSQLIPNGLLISNSQ